MAYSPRSIFLLVFLYTIAHRATSQRSLDSFSLNRTMNLSFVSRKNQTGHFINEWSVNNGASKLPNNFKIDMKSGVTKHGGIQFYHISVKMSVSPPRPPSYELFPGVGYYKFHPEGSRSYNLASSTCISEGGHLAIINSESEAEVMQTLFARYPNVKDAAYIGFNDIAEEGKYVTIFGQPIEDTGYVKWSPGQPDQGGGTDEDCGSIHRSALLNDLWCDSYSLWPFICEYDLSWAN